VGRNPRVVFEMGPKILINGPNEPNMILKTCSSSGVQLQVPVDVKWSVKSDKVGLGWKIIGFKICKVEKVENYRVFSPASMSLSAPGI
jgi:hypothetical protein